MTRTKLEKYASHCQSIIEMYTMMRAHGGGGEITRSAAHGVIARSRAAIESITGLNSSYTTEMKEILGMSANEEYKAEMLIGVLYALMQDLDRGFLENTTELIHGELFGNYLDMAEYLLVEKYKDAAAVIAGSTLEEHLRQLCKKHNVPIEIVTKDGSKQPKKASSMNQDLGKIVYSLYDQKQVTAWLDLRNSAAHGKYDEYNIHQVDMMVSGIRDFISRHPA